MAMRYDEFAALPSTGTKLPFYGVDGNRFKLGDVVYEALEDKSDGYRSYLKTVQVVPADQTEHLIFFKTPIAEVEVKSYERTDPYRSENEGYELVDADGHVWLSVGTDNMDDYYPCFRFSYEPKATAPAA